MNNNTYRAIEIMEAFIGDGNPRMPNKALASAIRACADRLCMDWAELQHPADVLIDIANELDEYEPD